MNEDRSLRQNTATRDLALGQIGFAFFIAICVALHPGLVLKANEGGMSNYGVHLKTAFPYTVALSLPTVLSFRAQSMLRPSDEASRTFRSLLRIYCVLIALTLLTTYAYTLDSVLKDVHDAVGIAITLFEAAASLWMYRRVRLTFVLVVQLVGFVLAVLTFAGVVHVLFLTQLLVGVTYAIFLVRTARALTR
jgi:hypothetical protein